MSSGEEVVGVMRRAAQVLWSVTSSEADELRALKEVVDAATAALADRLAVFDQGKSYLNEDASGTATWARRELRQDSMRTRQLIRAAEAMRDLPRVGESARAGRMSFDHVVRFAFALDHVDRDAVAEVADRFVEVAEQFPPSRVKSLVDRLRAIVHAEELDRAWIDGMAKADVNLHAVPDGWHLTGFLPIDVGTRFRAVLDSLSVPTTGGDTRTAAQRRVDGLEELLGRVLAEGLPTDGTVRPQLHVLVDAGTLQAALAPSTDSAFEPIEPATLIGFGPIGATLLAHLTCGADLIPVLVDRIAPNPTVLDVGRRHRHATPKQRHAIWVHQAGACATNGCHHSIDHLHHRRRWADGGPTDLANLVGLCHRCHRHEHHHDIPLARAG